MRWGDDGIVVYRKTASEGGGVVGLLTREHGRWNGWLSQKALPQLGEYVSATWNSRLEEGLGSWKFETASVHHLSNNGDRLIALSSLCQLCYQALPERHAYSRIFQAARDFIESGDTWRSAYIQFEVILLKELGFGLSLQTCAVTQSCEDLTYVSPKTGRAVCREAGLPYHHQLLHLPAFLTQHRFPPVLTESMYTEALQLTGYFINKHVCHNRLPPLRKMLVDMPWASNRHL